MKDFTELDILALKEANEVIEQCMDKWLISYGSIYPLFQLAQQKIKHLEERIQTLEKIKILLEIVVNQDKESSDLFFKQQEDLKVFCEAVEKRIRALEKNTPEVTEEEFYDRVVEETKEVVLKVGIEDESI